HYCDISESWPGTGNLNADPLFVDSTGYDYHLLPGSPCIASGNPGAPLESGGSMVEMGVFPFVATPNPLIPFGSVWKYLDTGSNQGTNWIAGTFDERAGAWRPAR